MNGLDYARQYSQLSNASQPQYSEEVKNSIWFYSLTFYDFSYYPLRGLLALVSLCRVYVVSSSTKLCLFTGDCTVNPATRCQSDGFPSAA